MDKDVLVPRPVSRITCAVHRSLGDAVTEVLLATGADTIMAESARGVRQRIRSRRGLLPGEKIDYDDAPMLQFRVSVPRAASAGVVSALVEGAQLRTPGHGLLYVQDVEHSSGNAPSAHLSPLQEKGSGTLRDMALLTCILSSSGAGDAFARVALSLGAGFPVISNGMGTGIRDQLGLLRIAIPPVKEIVRLMVPAQDAASVRLLLIDEGRLNRSGAGFLYQTPIREGLFDPLLRIGRQRHAASMEQVIAAIDDLKGSTGWRKRFVSLEERPENLMQVVNGKYREMHFNCRDGAAGLWVRAAMNAGAVGATTAQARRIFDGPSTGGGAAREFGVLCVPSAGADAVRSALQEVIASGDDPCAFLQEQTVSAVFAHKRSE
jgi:hypothetical protein